MATATDTKKTATNQAESPESKGALILSPPRLTYMPALEAQFGCDEMMWRALCDATFPGARTPEGIILAIQYCQVRKLDIFKRPVHVVSVWSSAKKRMVESVWPGIAEVRTTASRTAAYAGCDETVFGPDVEETIEGEQNYENDDGTWTKKKLYATIIYPDWARITVYKIVGGQRCPFPGPKIKWKEIYSRIGKTAVPNEKWERSPSFMLEKCAEAAALRKAFPEELGDVLTAEEMEGKTIDGDFVTVEAKAAAAAGDAPARPTRGDAAADASAKASSPPPPPPPAPPHKFEWTDLYGDTTEVEAVQFDGLFMEAIAKTKQSSPLEIVWENNSSQLSHLATIRANIIREAYAARLKELTAPKPESPIAGMIKLLDAVKTEKAMKTLLATNGERIQELADGPNAQAYADLQMAIDKTWARLRKPAEEGGEQS